LLFGRKNVIEMRPIDLRGAVGNMTKMLKRLLGETIVLEFKPPVDLPLVNADAGMLEQVLMNLSVNARDAMPRGGTLTISLDPKEVTEEYMKGHPEARAGEFVCIRVMDTGTGMDTATMARIFEPFFTTKEVGKGTGLGLATVYGIVTQHGGWIEVASEVGKGTVFTVFLPATDQPLPEPAEGQDTAAFVRGGSETILVVEDEPVLREMAHSILEESGYRIFQAGNGPQALKVWEQQGGKIDLLLTDMVMPEGVSGVELAEDLLGRHPQLRVLFTSGYTVDDVSSDYLARKNAQFLQKPYTSTTLVRAVRRSLDARFNEQPDVM
jgi:CheY-like chemotaxis protein